MEGTVGNRNSMDGTTSKTEKAAVLSRQSLMLDRLCSMQYRWQEEQHELRTRFLEERQLWDDERSFLNDELTALQSEFTKMAAAKIELQRKVDTLNRSLNLARLQARTTAMQTPSPSDWASNGADSHPSPTSILRSGNSRMASSRLVRGGGDSVRRGGDGDSNSSINSNSIHGGRRGQTSGRTGVGDDGVFESTEDFLHGGLHELHSPPSFSDNEEDATTATPAAAINGGTEADQTALCVEQQQQQQHIQGTGAEEHQPTFLSGRVHGMFTAVLNQLVFITRTGNAAEASRAGGDIDVDGESNAERRPSTHFAVSAVREDDEQSVTIKDEDMASSKPSGSILADDDGNDDTDHGDTKRRETDNLKFENNNNTMLDASGDDNLRGKRLDQGSNSNSDSSTSSSNNNNNISSSAGIGKDSTNHPAMGGQLMEGGGNEDNVICGWAYMEPTTHIDPVETSDDKRQRVWAVFDAGLVVCYTENNIHSDGARPVAWAPMSQCQVLARQSSAAAIDNNDNNNNNNNGGSSGIEKCGNDGILLTLRAVETRDVDAWQAVIIADASTSNSSSPPPPSSGSIANTDTMNRERDENNKQLEELLKLLKLAFDRLLTPDEQQEEDQPNATKGGDGVTPAAEEWTTIRQQVTNSWKSMLETHQKTNSMLRLARAALLQRVADLQRSSKARHQLSALTRSAPPRASVVENKKMLLERSDLLAQVERLQREARSNVVQQRAWKKSVRSAMNKVKATVKRDKATWMAEKRDLLEKLKRSEA